MLFKTGDAFCFYCVGAEPRLYPAWWIENSSLFRRIVVAREAAFRGLTEKDRSRAENLTALREMAARLATAKIPFVVVLFPYLLESLKKYPTTNVELHREVKSIVDFAGGITIDFLPIWLDRDHRTLRNRLDASDYVHPNEDGHREAADLLAGALLPRLR
jgi:lysophospholipase L1-like esterase